MAYLDKFDENLQKSTFPKRIQTKRSKVVVKYLVKIRNDVTTQTNNCAKGSDRGEGKGSKSKTPVQEKDTEKKENGKKSKSLGLCNECGKSGKLKKCALCRKVGYCSKECQTQAWGVHNVYCEGRK